MPQIQDFKYKKFTVDGKGYVLKTTARYDGLAQAFGMTDVAVTNGVVSPSEGEVVSAETAVKRGVMVPMVVNYRDAANPRKRGRGTVGIPIDQIGNLDNVTAKTYGEGNVITSVKFSTRRDFR